MVIQPAQWDDDYYKHAFSDNLQNQGSQKYENSKKLPANPQRRTSDINWNRIDMLNSNDDEAISDDDLNAMDNIVSRGFVILMLC